jgi:hypothetical protein
MSIIDKQRLAAVATLEALGYTYSLDEACRRRPTFEGTLAIMELFCV